MHDEHSRGPAVAPAENLIRAIVRPEWWNASEDRPSSAIFSHSKFSAFIDSLVSADHSLRRLPDGSGQFPDGSGVVRFNCGEARQFGFDARHEPELGDNAHANVYCDLNSNQRKKNIKKLMDSPTFAVTLKPSIERLNASRQSE